MMRIFEVHLKYWPFNDRYWGYVVYPFIFYREGKYSDTLRRHEWTHIRQIQRDGWFKYHYVYAMEYMKKGYYNVSYEIEAYAMQEDPSYQPWLEK